MRLEGIDTIEDANAFVPRYLETFNKKFGKRPASDIDAHRPLRESDDLDHTFCWREQRKLTKNLVLHYKRVMYLVDPTPETKRLANNKVDVHEWADGTVELWFKGQKLSYSIYDKNPQIAGDIVENKRLGKVFSPIIISSDFRMRPCGLTYPQAL